MDSVRILTYHRVGVPRGARTERLTVQPRRFAQQLRLLRLLRFGFSDLDETLAWLEGRKARIGRRVVLSFDDGYAELCEHAIPELVARGASAVIYLVANRTTDSWVDWGDKGPLRLLEWPQVRELAAAGVRFGSHTLTHPNLVRASDAELRAELADSKKLIEDRIGEEVRHFCYPHGAHDERVVNAVSEAGYATACTTRRGTVGVSTAPLRLPRLTVGKNMGARRFLTRLLLRH